MNSKRLICIAAFAVFAMMTRAVPLAARDKKDHKNAKHHHYQLIDIGTFGGPQSYYNSLNLTDVFGFPTVFYNIARVRNSSGVFVGFADTSLPDPFPGFCYLPECFVAHSFQWNNGVLTDLGALPGGGSSAAFWINEKGWITGNSENGETDPLIPGLPELRAVLWKNGEIKDLGTLGGASSFAQAINDRGQITGLALNGTPDPYSYYYLYLYGSSSGTETRGFVWDEENGMQDIGTLGGANAFPSVSNNHGQVAGFSDTSFIPDPNVGLPPFHPFLWEDGKGMKDLGSFGGVQTASVNGLNERGEVVGGLFLPGDAVINPFLWDGEKLIDLSVPPFVSSGVGEANWINEAGEVVGIASLPAPCSDSPQELFHAFLWRKGVMEDLGGLAGFPRSRADFINSRSQVVGGSLPCDFSNVTAFLWENGSMVDLNSLIPSNSELYLIWAAFVDDRGEIAALANLPNGNTHAALLIPCDENHPGIEGCDYSMVEARPTASVQPTVPATPGRMLPTSLWQRSNRFHFRGSLIRQTN